MLCAGCLLVGHTALAAQRARPVSGACDPVGWLQQCGLWGAVASCLVVPSSCTSRASVQAAASQARHCPLKVTCTSPLTHPPTPVHHSLLALLTCAVAAAAADATHAAHLAAQAPSHQDGAPGAVGCHVGSTYGCSCTLYGQHAVGCMAVCRLSETCLVAGCFVVWYNRPAGACNPSHLLHRSDSPCSTSHPASLHSNA